MTNMMKCFLWTWTRQNMSRVHKYELSTHPAQLWLNLNPRNIFPEEILSIFSVWWWFSPGADFMSSAVTGVNCPSCSLPYDRWETEAHQYPSVSDKTETWGETLYFRSQRRCLIDSCGHERCFSCIFLSQTQTCPLCLLSLTGETNSVVNYLNIQKIL